MDEARIDRAMNRIAAALDRIEGTARKSTTQDRELTSRHAALRQSVDSALAELDTLIGGLER